MGFQTMSDLGTCHHGVSVMALCGSCQREGRQAHDERLRERLADAEAEIACRDQGMVWPIREDNGRVTQANWDLVCGEILNLEDHAAKLEKERKGVVDACGFVHDDDPKAPKTLVEYVRETQEMALNDAEATTAADREGAIRRLSRNSKTLRARVDALEPKPLSCAPLDGTRIIIIDPKAEHPTYMYVEASFQPGPHHFNEWCCWDGPFDPSAAARWMSLPKAAE